MASKCNQCENSALAAVTINIATPTQPARDKTLLLCGKCVRSLGEALQEIQDKAILMKQGIVSVPCERN